MRGLFPTRSGGQPDSISRLETEKEFSENHLLRPCMCGMPEHGFVPRPSIGRQPSWRSGLPLNGQSLVPHAFSNRAHRSEEVHTDGAFGESCSFRDFENLHVFNEPKNEHRALSFGKTFGGVPHGLNLF